MTRWNVALGGGTVAVLAVLTVSVVRSVREVLAVERDRKRRALLVTPPRDGRPGQSLGSSRPQAPGPALSDEDMSSFLDDEIARTARRIIEAQGLVP